MLWSGTVKLAAENPAEMTHGQCNVEKGHEMSEKTPQVEDVWEEGSTTVEYAIGAVAAAAFAGLLLVILRSDSVRAALESIIQQALTVS